MPDDNDPPSAESWSPPLRYSLIIPANSSEETSPSAFCRYWPTHWLSAAPCCPAISAIIFYPSFIIL